MLRSLTKRRDCWTCCPLGSETEGSQGHTPTGKKPSWSTGHGSTTQPHGRCSAFEPEQKHRAQSLLWLQRHSQTHSPLRKGLLWLLVQRFLSHHSHVEMQSLTWGETVGKYTENLTFRLWTGLSTQGAEPNLVPQ